MILTTVIGILKELNSKHNSFQIWKPSFRGQGYNEGAFNKGKQIMYNF